MDPLEVLVRQCGGTEEMRYKHIVCVDSLAWKQYKDVFYTTITYVIALLVESHQKKKKMIWSNLHVNKISYIPYKVAVLTNIESKQHTVM